MRIAACLLLTLAFGVFAKDHAKDGQHPEPGDGPNYPALIKALDAKHYIDREVADRELRNLGASSVGPLRKALEGPQSSESNWRIRAVLQGLVQPLELTPDNFYALLVAEAKRMPGLKELCEVLAPLEKELKGNPSELRKQIKELQITDGDSAEDKDRIKERDKKLAALFEQLLAQMADGIAKNQGWSKEYCKSEAGGHGFVGGACILFDPKTRKLYSLISSGGTVVALTALSPRDSDEFKEVMTPIIARHPGAVYHKDKEFSVAGILGNAARKQGGLLDKVEGQLSYSDKEIDAALAKFPPLSLGLGVSVSASNGPCSFVAVTDKAIQLTSAGAFDDYLKEAYKNSKNFAGLDQILRTGSGEPRARLFHIK
ncbi:hypothetical protein K2X33_12725 [bacterium]|nr:hypothetical protein [bacterium]